MTRADETEVIQSTHVADTAGAVTSDYDRSPAYTDTEVTQNERTVKFWNTGTFSDTSTQRDRKWLCRIHIVGNGVDELSNWEEWEYTSPLAPHPLSPEKTITVPDLSQPSYDFDVFTVWELWEGDFQLRDGVEGPIVATVDDNSIGG